MLSGKEMKLRKSKLGQDSQVGTLNAFQVSNGRFEGFKEERLEPGRMDDWRIALCLRTILYLIM